LRRRCRSLRGQGLLVELIAQLQNEIGQKGVSSRPLRRLVLMGG